MVTKTSTTVRCNCCGNTLDDYQGYSGSAKLSLKITAGSNGGGSDRETVLRDLCLKCAFELERVIDTFRFNKIK